MAPEYAMEGLFSTKSDVYSFGVMMLEIISGQRNRGLCRAEHDENLVSYVDYEVLASHFLEETIIQMYVEGVLMTLHCCPDISRQRCYECLNGTGGYCNGRLGARYQNPSCNCGCRISTFYNETPADAPHHSHRLQVNPVHPPYGILNFHAWRPTEKPTPTIRPSILGQ
ncbi:hypothetical protein RJ640_005479 [Escallonia rubra]|uniref:Serine-threonine/tyrosine-protein kinase catalytic domain-containing protein n=1 Tax=Escallonia rubra TaxID=112253 RepID=A0AA88RKM1_9ASTE|nr:hypothetical protein RJ640_005479 [Escallonia rubra]